MNKVALIVTTFNRPDYLRQCFDSLHKLTMRPDSIIIVDDASNQGTRDMIIDFIGHWATKGCDSIFKEVNSGIRDSIQLGADHAFEKGADIVINLDGDAIVKPYFIERLVELKQNHPWSIVSGFNAKTTVNPIVHQYDDYCVKGYINGINMCFSKGQYEQYIKPSLQIVGNWDYNTSLRCREDNLPFLFTSPSVVQHIGLVSSMNHGSGDKADVAYDY